MFKLVYPLFSIHLFRLFFVIVYSLSVHLLGPGRRIVVVSDFFLLHFLFFVPSTHRALGNRILIPLVTCMHIC